MDGSASEVLHVPQSAILGISFIDYEHEYLFSVYNELVRTLAFAAGNRLFIERFSELTAYARDHFAHEDFVMWTHGYPEYVNHQKAHRALLRDAEDFAVNIRNYYEPYARYGVTLYVRQWLHHHIDQYDRPLARFLSSMSPGWSAMLHVPVLPPCCLLSGNVGGSADERMT